MNFNAVLVFRPQEEGDRPPPLHELRQSWGGTAPLASRPTLPVCSGGAQGLKRCGGDCFRGCAVPGAAENVFEGAQGAATPGPVQRFLSRLLQQCLPVSMSPPTSMSRAWAVQCLFACTEQFLSNLKTMRLTAFEVFSPSQPVACWHAWRRTHGLAFRVGSRSRSRCAERKFCGGLRINAVPSSFSA